MRDDINNGSDIVWSARGIARAINRGERATYRLLEQGALPARRVGKQWVASRNALRAALGCIEQAKSAS
jgi:hypothetical protein